MANETYLTVRGRLVSDPELRFTPNGAAVVNLTVAVNARKFDKQTNEWKDKEAKFWRCNAWNQGKLTLAENIAEGLKKGDAVLVYGELETRKYQTKEGENRSVDEIRIESIGKDLTFHKPQQSQGGGFQQPAQQPAPQQQGGNWNAPAADPWSSGGQQNNGGWGNPSDSPAF